MKIPSSLNLYAYCAGDPVNFADVNGHKPKYITEQKETTIVDGRPMGQIRVGMYGWGVERVLIFIRGARDVVGKLGVERERLEDIKKIDLRV